MNLKAVKDDKEIKSLFGWPPVSVERKDGNVVRITVGPIERPLLVIQRAGTYSDYMDVLSPEKKTIYVSETKMFGADVVKRFDDESERELWEGQTKRENPQMELIFNHSEISELV